MSDLHLSEDEQVDALKRWWKENGLAIVVGAVLGIGAVVGVWQWRDYQQKKTAEASLRYNDFTKAITIKDASLIDTHFAALRDDYSGTAYSHLASLMMAKRYLEAKEVAKAEQALRYVLEDGSHPSLQHLARVRLASIFIDTDRLTEALTLINSVQEKAYIGEYAELRGDIYMRQGEAAKAREAYALALEQSEIQGQRRQFIEMKRDNVAGVVNQAAAPAPDADPAASKEAVKP